ncbi:hypothetical protein [Microcoleus sp. AT3-D2]|uniref:hypothetical protein n=1 Tax=Microcoleus sp. AT3-D2 TaxID=2818612 RepID=UPI002FD4355C
MVKERGKREEGRRQNKNTPTPPSSPAPLPADDRRACYNLVKRPYSELMEILVRLVLGSVLLVWGRGFGKVLVRSPVTEEDLFKGRNSIALALAIHSRAIVLTDSIQDTSPRIHPSRNKKPVSDKGTPEFIRGVNTPI